MQTTAANNAITGHQTAPQPLTREQEIEKTVRSEYRREQVMRKDVILFSPGTLRRMADGGFKPLRQESRLELKLDVLRALRKFTPAQRLILGRVLIQGQAVDVATKGSKKSSSYWHYWLQNTARPQLRTALNDYFVNGKVVI